MVGKETLSSEPCYKEAKQVSDNIAHLVNLSIDRYSGERAVDEDIDRTVEDLTSSQLSLRRCITRFIVANR